MNMPDKTCPQVAILSAGCQSGILVGIAVPDSSDGKQPLSRIRGRRQAGGFARAKGAAQFACLQPRLRPQRTAGVFGGEGWRGIAAASARVLRMRKVGRSTAITRASLGGLAK